MNDTMAVIYIAQTGHVIGAITCNSDPKRSLAPADLAGSDVAGPGFLLTAPRKLHPGPDPFEEFSVPVGSSSAPVLSVSPPVPFNAAVFQAAPGTFSVSDGVIGSIGTAFPATWVVTLSPATLAIDFTAGPAISTDTPVWAQIQDPNPLASSPPETLVLAGTIPQGSASVQLPLTILPKGAPASLISGKSYSVALMVGGYGPDFVRRTA